MNQPIKPTRDSHAEKRPVRFLKFKLLMLVGLCALPGYGMVAYGLHGGHGWVLGIYPLMSLLAFGLYGYDKQQARRQGHRIAEKWLHSVELLGGWPGALVAQQVFRHKTRKFSFQWVFWLIVLMHELLWADQVLAGGNFLARHFY
ncbi:DUF1294 domain-containing protein [Pseudomonas sp. GD03842]|uniref:DUF1294 domain-containing protein n=1 Tax=unclassified Pseudomonas TaxID=196821 RepID=UPI000D336C78|nr:MULTISPECIES: DUF1294 domain-containing protein [unclassified Pseudomonas]MDH0745093.1 DUF1294 domain-containing protein [Pseudomonas sp. GD03842]RAU48053.1 DUF1294 domain-containing protein [Pseudomonas sp. RIT 409]RAU55251.1 DUF1294 domain-containing protein [Pseudomonas sp. RIT 412]